MLGYFSQPPLYIIGIVNYQRQLLLSLIFSGQPCYCYTCQHSFNVLDMFDKVEVSSVARCFIAYAI